MGNFIDCWTKHAGDNFSKGDKEAILARIREHTEAGVDPKEAARLAVEKHLGDTHEQLQDIYKQAGLEPPQPTAEYLKQREDQRLEAERQAKIQADIEKQKQEALDTAKHYEEQAKVAENPKVKATLEEFAQKYRDQAENIKPPEPKAEAPPAQEPVTQQPLTKANLEPELEKITGQERETSVRSDKEVEARADKEIARDPNAADRILKEVQKSPRPLKDWEESIMRRRTAALQSQRDALIERINKGGDVGDAKLLSDTQNKIADLYDTILSSHSEAGRTLRQIGQSQDFSADQLKAEARAAQNGKSLNAAQETKVKDISSKLEKAKKTVEQKAVKQQAFVDKMQREQNEALSSLKEKYGKLHPCP